MRWCGGVCSKANIVVAVCCCFKAYGKGGKQHGSGGAEEDTHSSEAVPDGLDKGFRFQECERSRFDLSSPNGLIVLMEPMFSTTESSNGVVVLLLSFNTKRHATKKIQIIAFRGCGSVVQRYDFSLQVLSVPGSSPGRFKWINVLMEPMFSESPLESLNDREEDTNKLREPLARWSRGNMILASGERSRFTSPVEPKWINRFEWNLCSVPLEKAQWRGGVTFPSIKLLEMPQRKFCSAACRPGWQQVAAVKEMNAAVFGRTFAVYVVVSCRRSGKACAALRGTTLAAQRGGQSGKRVQYGKSAARQRKRGSGFMCGVLLPAFSATRFARSQPFSAARTGISVRQVVLRAVFSICGSVLFCGAKCKAAYAVVRYKYAHL
ncbi:hypothetical protein NPIL_681581 [Nephila pilipes]|uniref:Uncharacterized protein n=1 Tax=Nephila pilipes TaxID=299642 RepID=A0A8X6P6P6_NEPPI|nr:hypothetical protein NPIL_681581 [Nephila pilipes]